MSHQQPYGQQPQPYYQQPPQAVPSSGMATASLVLGILGFVTCGIASIPAVVLGHVALGQTKGGRMLGRGQAVWGTILGYVVLTPWIIFWVMVIAGAVSAPFLPTVPTPTPITP